MSPTFVDNDGQPDWRKIGYHARSAFAVLLSAVVLFGGGWFVVTRLTRRGSPGVPKAITSVRARTRWSW